MEVSNSLLVIHIDSLQQFTLSCHAAASKRVGFVAIQVRYADIVSSDRNSLLKPVTVRPLILSLRFRKT